MKLHLNKQCNPFFEIWICKSLSERKKKDTNDLYSAWQNIAETIAFADKRKSILVLQIQGHFGE